MLAAPHLHQRRARRQLAEQRSIQDAFGGGRQRQQANQNIAAGQKRAKLGVTDKAADAGDGFGRAAPAGAVEAQLHQRR
jgi:hypothetical protein